MGSRGQDRDSAAQSQMQPEHACEQAATEGVEPSAAKALALAIETIKSMARVFPLTPTGEAVLTTLSAALHSATAEAAEAHSLLNQAWAAVNALGSPDAACATDEERAYCRAIGDALAEIEKLAVANTDTSDAELGPG